ncbi:MAG: hypothetical protein LUQ11_08605 [Methylococcaceae bacterium]|nr:hypothetical protein [Methylococcaceae bacterium]
MDNIENKIMQRVLVQYERLRRHYEHTEKTYDYASFLDLSHALRIWTELKTVLPRIDKTFTSKMLFKSAVPNRKILRACSKVEYIVAFMPDGVISHASNGNLFSWQENNKDFSVGGHIMRMGDGALKMADFYFCFPNLTDGANGISLHPKISRLNFIQWLGAEIVRINFRKKDGNLEVISIPREILIKRVANILDASHTSLEKSGDFDNRFDEPIKFLMAFSCGGCPIPYFLLLKVAQDIVEHGPKLIPIRNL